MTKDDCIPFHKYHTFIKYEIRKFEEACKKDTSDKCQAVEIFNIGC